MINDMSFTSATRDVDGEYNIVWYHRAQTSFHNKHHGWTGAKRREQNDVSCSWCVWQSSLFLLSTVLSSFRQEREHKHQHQVYSSSLGFGSSTITPALHTHPPHLLIPGMIWYDTIPTALAGPEAQTRQSTWHFIILLCIGNKKPKFTPELLIQYK